MPRKPNFSFQRGEDTHRVTQMRLDGLDRYASSGRRVAYQPTLTSNGTQPVITPESLAGSYVRQNTLLTAFISMVITGGFSAGSGRFLFGLPAELLPLLDVEGVAGHWRSTLLGVDTEGSIRHWLADPTKVSCSYPAAYPSGAPQHVGAGTPGTWQAGSQIHLVVTGLIITNGP